MVDVELSLLTEPPTFSPHTSSIFTIIFSGMDAHYAPTGVCLHRNCRNQMSVPVFRKPMQTSQKRPNLDIHYFLNCAMMPRPGTSGQRFRGVRRDAQARRDEERWTDKARYEAGGPLAPAMAISRGTDPQNRIADRCMSSKPNHSRSSSPFCALALGYLSLH